MRVLALCVANSARSQIAEGWLRALSTPDVLVYSAGSRPTAIRAEAIAAMAEVGIDLGQHHAKGLSEVPSPDFVVTLCDDEVCPNYSAEVTRLSWPTPDPAAVEGSAAERLQAFRRARDEIGAKVDAWLTEIGRRVEFGAIDGFALRKDITFLNNGSFGATPRQVLAAQRRLQDELEAQPVAFMRALPARTRRVASLVASFLRSDPQDLVFVDNATTGVTAVLRSQRWKPGDVVYTTSHVYGAVRSALEHLKRTVGIEVVYGEVPFPIGSSREVLDAIGATLPANAKLAIVDHITSATGLIFPAAEIVALCRGRGIPVLIDGAHVPGHLPVDLGALDADYWVGNLHKWLYTPKGCAVLRVRRDRRDALEPLVFSHEIGRGFSASFDFQGTRDPSPWLAAEAALGFVEALGGPDRIRAHNFALRRTAGALLCERWHVEPPAPLEMLGALQTLPLPARIEGTAANAAAWNARLWDEQKIEIPFIPFGGRLWIRTSAQIFNTLSDYERLADVLAGMQV